MNRFLHYAAFFVGLAAVCWVGAGYIGSNPLALAITAADRRLLPDGRAGTAPLPPGHRHAWRSAVADAVGAAGEPGPLARPAPPFAAERGAPARRGRARRPARPGPDALPRGLLVLLGMLGTFLGMVVTLNGTGTALESAADLQAIRASLAAPVKGLGLAFGTSLAGVAASAMLGLVSRPVPARPAAGRRSGSTRGSRPRLRVFSQAHQREESFKLLQRQAEAMPALVDRLQAMMATMERQSQALNERLAAEPGHLPRQGRDRVCGPRRLGRPLPEGRA